MRVVIAEDSVLLREGLARLLGENEIEVVGQAGDGEDLLRKVRAHKPDVAIVDVRMPPDHTDEGLRAARQIRDELPATGVLVLSQDVEGFVEAVRRVAGGGSALDPQVVSTMLGRADGSDPLEGLTEREREVLALMAEGRSNAAVAERMVVTERAVEKHVTSIFAKLDLPPTPDDHRRVLAVLRFLDA